MLNAILKWSIVQRWLVVIGAIAIALLGTYNLSQMPLDVFPDFAPPQVEVQTEAPGFAPEEVETLITLPLERAVNGTPGVQVVRSSSATGISVVKVTFEWGTDIYRARQLVTERLQLVTNLLPEGVETPQISPVISPLGNVINYAFVADTTSMMDLRQRIDRDITPRLLAVPGVAQVVIYGGEERQYQVLVDPQRLAAAQVSLGEVTAAAQGANRNAPGGLAVDGERETLLRAIGRVEELGDLASAVVTARGGQPILLGDVATVQVGPALKRGDAFWHGRPAVVVMVNKQPGIDTPTVTRAIEGAIAQVEGSLPTDVTVGVTFRQADFIEAAVGNVRSALRDGAIVVAVVMMLFLLNWRTALITLSAIPLSLLIGVAILRGFGLTVDTMTLGGLAVAIGSVVDDSIVDMENAYRGLRENQERGFPLHPFQVVYDTSVEVRTSVIFSTVIIGVVFAPIFSLTGVEGRIFAPMGIAYLVSIFASTGVAMTLSPALCAILLAHQRLPPEGTGLVRALERFYQPVLALAIARSRGVLLAAIATVIAALAIMPGLGREFLPPFQERSLVNSVVLYPGVALEMTNRAGAAIAAAMADDPRFTSIQLRSGRAEGDADAAGPNIAHLDMELSEVGLGNRDGAIAALREEFRRLPGVAPNIGGFITHRMDEVLSGVRSAIAVKIFGPDLAELRRLGQQVQAAMATVDGVEDLQLEPQVPIPQVQIQFDRAAAGRYGLSMDALAETVETALNGRVVSQVLEQQQLVDVLVWLTPAARMPLDRLGQLPIDTPSGATIPLAQVAQITPATGPNTIGRENVARLVVVAANAGDRDLGSVVTDIQAAITDQVTLPEGYFIAYGGQFESEERARQTLLLFGAIAVVIVTAMMVMAVRSLPGALAIMANLPLAIAGGIVSVAISGGVLSVASLVGFITLFGVAVRNGLLLVDNYTRKRHEGYSIQEAIRLGSQERLVPILMTALTSALGMIPLVLGNGAGEEILRPLAIVVLGGLISSTALTLIVVPALYGRFGRWLLADPAAGAFAFDEVDEVPEAIAPLERI
ncbi:MAG: efflux RND transporter permease subunit [Cyanophyceae cyanobacterium]